METDDHAYFLSKSKRELKILHGIFTEKREIEKTAQVKHYLDNFAKYHPRLAYREAEARQERKRRVENKRLWMKLKPYFQSIWLVTLLGLVVFMGLNLWTDGHLFGGNREVDGRVTIRQALTILLLGIGTFTWGIADFLRGAASLSLVSEVRNAAMIFCGFIAIAGGIVLLVTGK